MPIYVYRCQDCSQIHEALVRDSKPEPTDCPHCQKGTLRRIVAAHARPVTSAASEPMCSMPSGGCGMGGCGPGGCGFPG